MVCAPARWVSCVPRAQVSYIEIYQDEIRDLLATGAAAGAPIVLRESAARGVTPENVKCGPTSACQSCPARYWQMLSRRLHCSPHLLALLVPVTAADCKVAHALS